MRRLVYGFGIVMMSIVFLTGCGESEKTLTCTITTSEDGVILDSEESYTFKGTDVSKVAIKMTYRFDEEILSLLTDEEISDMIDEIADNLNDEIETDEGTVFHVEKKSDHLIFTLDGDTSKMSAANKKTWVGDSSSYSYDMSKKNLESEGYTCK